MHLGKKNIKLLIAGFALLLLFLHIQNANAGGIIIVNNDEWTLSNTGFAKLPEDTKKFALNLAEFFAGGIGSFHAYSNLFAFTQSSLNQVLTGAGHTYTTGTNISFDLDTLLSFDGIFFSGNLLNDEQFNTLIDYVNSGGNVYFAAGWSNSNPAAVANNWNKFLKIFGMSIALNNNGIIGNMDVTGSKHPIFAGVESLYQNNGQDIFDLDTVDPSQEILVHYGIHGLYATVVEFEDVPPDYWAEDHIYVIFNAGITKGCSQNPMLYCPKKDVTRDQMAAFLVRAVEGEPPADYCATGSPFSDVSPASGFCKYIKRLSELGITKGCGGDRYCPKTTVKRDQMAAFLVRAVEGEPPANYCATGSPFPDVSPASVFCKYIKRLSELEITQGCGGGNYCPKTTVKRDQMAVFLGRAFLEMD